MAWFGWEEIWGEQTVMGSAPPCFPLWELLCYQSWGMGCRRPGWEAAMVQITVKGAQYWKVYLLTDKSCIFSIASPLAIFLALFLSWLINQAGKKSVIFWDPSKTLTEVGNQGRTWIITSSLLWPCVFTFTQGKEAGEIASCYQLLYWFLACEIYDTTAGICHICLDIWYSYDIGCMCDASQLSQGLESHWIEGLIHIYFNLFTPGFAGKGPPVWLAHHPGELVSKPGMFIFLPWGWHHCVGCTLSGISSSRSCVFFIVRRHFWRYSRVALLVTVYVILGWDGPFLCLTITCSADFISILFGVRHIQKSL